jgi:hypothetical protein
MYIKNKRRVVNRRGDKKWFHRFNVDVILPKYKVHPSNIKIEVLFHEKSPFFYYIENTIKCHTINEAMFNLTIIWETRVEYVGVTCDKRE